MTATSLSLLLQLKDADAATAWDRLLRIYGPLLRRWLQRYDLQDSDRDDVLQEILLAVARDITSFDHNGRAGAFRAWLKSIMVNRIRTHWRSRNRPAEAGRADRESQLAQLEDPVSPLSRLWEQEHDQHVLKELLHIVKPHFQRSTWDAFRLVTLEGLRADEAAARLETSTNAVFIARSRVLGRLRQEAEGLIDSSSAFS